MSAGRNTITSAGRELRVFLSYAHTDGEPLATELRQRLEAEHIPLWQDRVGMEGGRDWWQQITEALDKVEFIVLVMTPATMLSETVRKEWRYARQQGVCVYPVKGVPDLDFNSLPHWMRCAHFYDLDYEWQKLVNDLNTRCQQPRVPFMVEDLPAYYVPRPQEFEALI
ncbi:MAG TPA: toll/interleukin-1 receptor domain-containing protein, partial [Ktedonobacteraceae bacterium]